MHMRCNAERLIQALVTAQLKEQHVIDKLKTQQRWDKSTTLVVTVSRNFGALGREVAQLLADTLEVRCCDRDILQEVARRADVDEQLVKVLDEHINRIDKHWWQALINKNAFSYEDYYNLGLQFTRLLINNIKNIRIH